MYIIPEVTRHMVSFGVSVYTVTSPPESSWLLQLNINRFCKIFNSFPDFSHVASILAGCTLLLIEYLGMLLLDYRVSLAGHELHSGQS